MDNRQTPLTVPRDRDLRSASMSTNLYKWRIFRIRGTPAGDLGIVEAPDAETAIKVAIEEFKITNPEQKIKTDGSTPGLKTVELVPWRKEH